MNAPIRIKDPNASGRQYNFNLTFGGMAVLLTALTLALSLFFVLGVLVGRGGRPETALPVVAKMMPKESSLQPAAEVLKPEELGYADQLGRSEGAAPSRSIDKTEHKAADKKDDKKAAALADKKAEKSADKKAEKPAAKPASKPAPKNDEKKDTAKKSETQADTKPDPDNQRYDYAYQVATFPDMDQAKTFLKRVKSLGLKGDIESGAANGKSWNRVVVFFQGTPTETRALKEKLGGLGAQKLVMRSKTPM